MKILYSEWETVWGTGIITPLIRHRGKWFAAKVLQENSDVKTNSGSISLPCIPSNGWRVFSSQNIPSLFNYGGFKRWQVIAFKHLPVVAFRRCPNLRDLLVSAKLPSNSTNPNPQLPCRSFRCEKNCATCPYISDGLTSYTFFSTGETRTIKSNLTCDTKNLIYMIQCNRCNLQYIGETKRRLKDRFNEHRRTIDKPNTKS